MNVFTKIWWYRVMLVVALVTAAFFIITFFASIGTVINFGKKIAAAEQMLNQLAEAQALTDAAVNEGRAALFSTGEGSAVLEQKRSQAINVLNRLIETMTAHHGQAVYAELLKTAVLARFASQDDQVRSSKNQGPDLVLNLDIAQRADKAGFDLESSFAGVRMAELDGLFRNARSQVQQQWEAIYLMIAFLALLILSLLMAILSMLSELNLRKKIADGLRNNIHMSHDGQPLYSKRDIDQIAKILEEGEAELAKYRKR